MHLLLLALLNIQLAHADVDCGAAAFGRKEVYVTPGEGYGDYKVTPLAGVEHACRNLGLKNLELQLPVLSRDGSLIALRDETDQKSKVYKFGKSREQCTLKAEIPEKTGELSFSFDNNRVVFLTEQLNDVADQGNVVGHIKEFNLTTKTSTTLTGPTENGLYAAYKPDGSILITLSSVRAEQSPGLNLIVIDRDIIPQADTAQGKAAAAIGQIWGKVCKNTFDSDYAITAGARMNKKNCAALLNKENMALLDASSSPVSLESLQAYCGQSADVAGERNTPVFR